MPEGHISDTARSMLLKFIGRPGLERAPRRQVMADLRSEKLRWQRSLARQLQCAQVDVYIHVCSYKT